MGAQPQPREARAQHDRVVVQAVRRQRIGLAVRRVPGPERARHADVRLGRVVVGGHLASAGRPIRDAGARQLAVEAEHAEIVVQEAEGRARPDERPAAHAVARAEAAAPGITLKVRRSRPDADASAAPVNTTEPPHPGREATPCPFL